MGTPRPLSKPPIKEALIDIRIATDTTVDLDRLRGIRSELAIEYPSIDERHEFKAELRIEAGKIVPPSAENLGLAALVFATADKTRLVQVRRDGFTVNQVGGYTTADALIDEALRLAAIYSRIVAPVAVTRIAMRYINALALPYAPGEDFKKYLTAPPDMPEDAPQTVSSFLCRMVAHDGEDVVIVTQKLDPPLTDGGSAAVTLDVDAFSPIQIEPNLEVVSAVLRRLRLLKNRTFFALLTDQALELYV
jgi:uncharacterized protein (TIGR04255 family)